MARINFELNELQAFIAVADKSSFKAAAEALYLSQPALSRRIDRLEQALQVRLLERTTRSVRLTGEGVHFLQHAQAVVEELEAAMHGLGQRQQLRCGMLTIASIPSVAQQLLPEVLAAFARAHPQHRLRVLDENAQEVLACVLDGRADLGINFVGGEDPGIDFLPLLTERYLLVVRRDHPLASRSRVRLQELAGEKLVSVSPHSSNRLLLDHQLAALAERPQIYYEANHLSGVYGMVLAGMGPVIVPELSLTQAQRHMLVGIEISEPALSRTLGLIQRKGSHNSPQMRQLIDQLRRAFQQGQPQGVAE
ncbi:LysR family transcriptional regulator [Aquitalea magnusonii]|uniref:DNA-binding transcriptional LysR family regulator n=1 Tax=Aquitalea magnusonii TaxID=332411 RepID=A0A318JKU0_9NEIS|nr:LysR family transcriptional regulator [Aquitalea magnusonii]PXX51225.1 DNA-binding transcriptional LysR family regulator [Aquitalea magnusonii]